MCNQKPKSLDLEPTLRMHAFLPPLQVKLLGERFPLLQARSNYTQQLSMPMRAGHEKSGSGTPHMIHFSQVHELLHTLALDSC